MRHVLLVIINVLVALGLFLPAGIDELVIPRQAGAPEALAAAAAPTETGETAQFSKRSKIKKKRRQDRRDKKEKKREKHRKKANGKRKGNGKKRNGRQRTAAPRELPSGRLPAAQRLDFGGQINIEDHYIVVLADSSEAPLDTATDLASDTGDIVPTYVYDEVFEGFAAIIPDGSLETVRNDPRVEAVIPDRVVTLSAQTQPSGIKRIGTLTNPTADIDGVDEHVDVDVAVLDTAGNLTHPDLNIFRAANCSSSPITGDSNGHGTHVGGTIGALDNDIGVVGVAPGARIWNVKVLNNNGSGTESSVICGLNFVRAHASEIEVANLSLGGEDPVQGTCQNDAFHKAFCDLVAAGVTVVVAAGNESDDARYYTPAAYDEVITVSALADSDGKPGGLGPSISGNKDDSLASFSNFGHDIDIAAPGVSILSTVPGGYAKFSGTSMAAPHVAGAAALYKAANPSASPLQVKAALLAARENIALPNDHDGYNEGVLNIGGELDPDPPPLDPDPDPPPPDRDVIDPTVHWQAPVGNGQEFRVSSGTVTLQAAASDNIAIDRVEFWLYLASIGDWILIDTDRTAPYQSSINVGSLAPGPNLLSADAYDTSGNWAYELISINKTDQAKVSKANKNKEKAKKQAKHKKKKKHKRGKKRRR